MSKEKPEKPMGCCYYCGTQYSMDRDENGNLDTKCPVSGCDGEAC